MRSEETTPDELELEFVEEIPAPETTPAPADTYQPSPRRIAPQEN